ncbi:hypothetical protein SFy_1634 [Shigella flexneri 2003036]|nr:hypothetical protein SFy_1634 [Shigella flexneri 2003036]
MPLCVVIQFSGVCGENSPVFRSSAPLANGSKSPDGSPIGSAITFNASTALLITRLLKVALCSE